MKPIHISLVALPLLLAGAAVAQDGGPHRAGGLRGAAFGLLRFDANADGRLTRAELDAAQRAHFNELDGDRNGSVTREEMRAAMDKRRKEAEAARFTRLDADKNGQLSQAELAAAQSRDGAHGFGRMDRRGPGPAGQKDGRRAATRDSDAMTYETFAKRADDMFARADTDKNGTVAVKEMQEAAPRR